MDRNSFLSKTSCTFSVITYDHDPELVTRELGLQPDRICRKGDLLSSKHSPRMGKRPWGVWELRSAPIVGEEVDVSTHIAYFSTLLGEKIEVIRQFKEVYRFECIFSISLETEDAGAGFDLREAELSFILSISSRYSCHVITRERIAS